MSQGERMNKQYAVDGKFVSRDEYVKSKEKAIAAANSATSTTKTPAKESK